MEKGNWYKDILKKKPFKKLTFKFFLYVLFALLPAVIIISFIHESGHYIMALCVGWDVSGIHLNFFPFTNDFGYSYILLCPDEANIIEYSLVAMAGSIHTLIWGYIFFVLYYKFELPSFLEIFLFLYSVMLVLEITIYLIIDIFIFQFGDWFIVFRYTPYLVPIFIIISYLNLYLFLKNIEKIRENLQIKGLVKD